MEHINQSRPHITPIQPKSPPHYEHDDDDDHHHRHHHQQQQPDFALLDSRLTMDDGLYSSSTSPLSSSLNMQSDPNESNATESAEDAAAADAVFAEFIFTSPRPNIDAPSTPLSSLRSDNQGRSSPHSPVPVPFNFPPLSPVAFTIANPPVSPSYLQQSFSLNQPTSPGFNHGQAAPPMSPYHGNYNRMQLPTSPIGIPAPPPSPIGAIDAAFYARAQVQNGNFVNHNDNNNAGLTINTSLSPPVKPELFDFDFLSATSPLPLSPARPASSCSMTGSLSSSSLSSLSTSASYGSSLSSYVSYGAPPNTFPYNLSGAAASATARPHSPAHNQIIHAPTPIIGLNPTHVDPSLLGSPPKTNASYPHLQPGPPASLIISQDGRAPSPLPSPTSASAAAALIGVGSTPQYLQQQQQRQYYQGRPTTPQTPVSATANLSLSQFSYSNGSNSDDARAETQLHASAKRRREMSEQGNHSYAGSPNNGELNGFNSNGYYNTQQQHDGYGNVLNENNHQSLSSYASPSKRSLTASPEKRSTPSSSGGSAKSNKAEIWPEDVEAAFMEALRVIPKLGRRKVMINGKPCGRNELIADYIKRKTLKVRSRKQVSSHIQVLKNLRRNDDDFMNLVTENMEDVEGFPAALLQAGFHMAQIPCLKMDHTLPNFALGVGLPTLAGLAASPMPLHQALPGSTSSNMPVYAAGQMDSTTNSANTSYQSSIPYPPFYFGGKDGYYNSPPKSATSAASQHDNSYDQDHTVLGPALYGHESGSGITA